MMRVSEIETMLHKLDLRLALQVETPDGRVLIKTVSDPDNLSISDAQLQKREVAKENGRAHGTSNLLIRDKAFYAARAAGIQKRKEERAVMQSSDADEQE